MKVNSLRRHVNGRGTIRARKMSISVTKRRKTWKKSNSKHVSNIVEWADEGWYAAGRKRAAKLIYLGLTGEDCFTSHLNRKG